MPAESKQFPLVQARLHELMRLQLFATIHLVAQETKGTGADAPLLMASPSTKKPVHHHRLLHRLQQQMNTKAKTGRIQHCSNSGIIMVGCQAPTTWKKEATPFHFEQYRVPLRAKLAITWRYAWRPPQRYLHPIDLGAVLTQCSLPHHHLAVDADCHS